MNPLIMVTAFLSEYLDSGLGMGYGTALAPILIIMGHEPLKVVPAVLISQLFTDIAACIAHHKLYNVDLRIGSKDFKAALALGAISSIGVIIAVIAAVNIPKWLLTLYIGLIVFAMGILILISLKKPTKFSWNKIIGLGLIASFNKGISGGGYGPIIMGGQILSGVHVKNAIGITAFAEAITCLIGFVLYLVSGKEIDWLLTGLLVVSATLAVPCAALTVKSVEAVRLKKYIGVLIAILGLLTFSKIK
jgi:uncharacterized protein